MSIDGVETVNPSQCELDDADKWILHRLNEVTGQVSANLDGFELGLAAQKIYDFIWLEFCGLVHRDGKAAPLWRFQ